jgi:suppressor of G2 allele of SKP1
MSQHATLGATALERKDYAAAVRHYTAALADFPSSPDYHMKRAMAHQRSTPPQPALALLDAERAVHFAHQRGKREALAAAQLRRAIALLALRRYGDAQQCLAWARDRNEKEPGLGMWEAKVEAALRKLRDADAAAGSSGDAAAAAAAAAAGASGGAEGEAGGEARQQAEGGTAGDAWMTEVTVVEIPEMDEINQRAKESKAATSAKANTQAAADAPSAPAQVEVPKGVQTPAHKIRHDWYQTADTVVLTLLVKGVPKDEASIEIRERSVRLELKPAFSPLSFCHTFLSPPQQTEKRNRKKKLITEFIYRSPFPSPCHRVPRSTSRSTRSSPQSSRPRRARPSWGPR